jgi:hypothetical protein
MATLDSTNGVGIAAELAYRQASARAAYPAAAAPRDGISALRRIGRARRALGVFHPLHVRRRTA